MWRSPTEVNRTGDFELTLNPVDFLMFLMLITVNTIIITIKLSVINKIYR